MEFVSPQSSSTPVYEEVDVMRGGKCYSGYSADVK